MKKNNSIFFLIIIFYFFIVVFFFFYFFLGKAPVRPVKVYNVTVPMTSVNNTYSISLDEQIKANLETFKTAFFNTPGYSKIKVQSVSKFVNVNINSVKGTSPYCSPLISSSTTECTSIQSIYSLISSHINKISLDMLPPHNIAHYYIFKYNNNYYFLDSSYRKTIYNKGFSLYWIK